MTDRAKGATGAEVGCAPMKTGPENKTTSKARESRAAKGAGLKNETTDKAKRNRAANGAKLQNPVANQGKGAVGA